MARKKASKTTNNKLIEKDLSWEEYKALVEEMSDSELGISERLIDGITEQKDWHTNAERLDLLVGLLKRGKQPAGYLAKIIFGSDGDTHRNNIGKDIKRLRKQKKFKDILNEDDSYRGSGYRGRKQYWLESHDLGSVDLEMDIDMAVSFDLAEDYLKDFLPSENFRRIEHIFYQAKERLKKYSDKQRMHAKRWDFDRVSKRVKVMQRGQELRRKKAMDNSGLDIVYQAIAEEKSITFNYKKGIDGVPEPRGPLLVGGVIHRPPKIYVYAGDQQSISEANKLKGKVNPFKTYLFSSMSDIEMSGWFPVKSDYYADMQDFIDDGWVDVPVQKRDKEGRFSDKKHDVDLNEYEIVIRVKNSQNIIRDLQDFQVGKNQTLKKNKDGTYTLKFTSKRTHQLVKYILLGGSDFEVIKPKALAFDVKELAERIFDIYNF